MTDKPQTAPQMIRYRVLKKFFHTDGVLYDPATMSEPYIVAPSGIKSAALRDASLPDDDKPKALGGQAPVVPSVAPAAADAAAKRIAELEDLVRSGTEAVQQLQGLLDHERKEKAEKIADLEAQLAAKTAVPSAPPATPNQVKK